MAASRGSSVLRLDRPTQRELARLDRDGFVNLPGVLDGCDFASVRRAVAAVNRHHRRLPTWALQDLGNDTDQLPQVNGLTRLYPGLRRTEIVERLRLVAERVLGEPAVLRFDFSITKPPGSAAEVPWHQDRAYHPDDDVTERLHMWIPLQDTNATMGCMEYLAGSHRGGRVDHRLASEDHRYALMITEPPAGPAVQCETGRGDVILHTSLTWHRTGPNRSHQDRAMWALEFERASGGRSGSLTAERLRRSVDVLSFRAGSLRR